MPAVKFDAQVTDDTIKIPPVYRGELNGPVHVIVIPSTPSGRATKIDELLASPLKIDAFRRLSRDAAHQRQ